MTSSIPIYPGADRCHFERVYIVAIVTRIELLIRFVANNSSLLA